jgi:predicted Zn-dependent protease
VGDGKIKYPVIISEISGNATNTLENIAEIGSEKTVEIMSGACGKYFQNVLISYASPSILVLNSDMVI